MEKNRLEPMRGKIITLTSNMRWCSDCFTIQCANGERVFVAFALDTCDREILKLYRFYSRD